MPISFNGIPVAIRTPGQYIEIDNSRAFQGLPAQPNRILVIGQRLVAGTVAEGVPTRIATADQAIQAFGRGSMLAAMLAALKAANTFTECWAIALDDLGAGAAATGTITPGGAPTSNGTLALLIAGKKVPVGVTAGDTPAEVATAIAAAVNADADLPVTANAAAAVVTLTARQKGEVGNDIDVRVNYYQGEALPAGLTCAIVALSGGTGNPDIADAIAVMGDTQYHTIVTPYTDAANLTALETELARRFGPMVQKEGHAFAAAKGTQGQLSTLGDTRNSPHICIVGAGKSPSPTYAWAAVVAAVDSFEPDPARPRQTLPLPGLLPPVPTEIFTRDERNLLLGDGIATYTVDAGGQCLVERLVTTYKTNAFGAEDPSYLDVETLRTVAYLRFSLRNRIALKFPRHKLANDGTRFGTGQAVVTPAVVRDEIIALFRQWEDSGLVEGIDQFKRDLIVERNASDPNRLDAYVPPDIVNQLRVFAAQLGFRL